MLLHFLSGLLNGLLIAFLPLAYLLRYRQGDDVFLTWLGMAIYATFALLAVTGVWTLFRDRIEPTAPTPGARRILVDGSNVMHWGGDPSMMVLQRVVTDLQGKGFAPIVYFDANVGYKLFSRFCDSAEMAGHLGLDPSRVTVVPSGVIADEYLLQHATRDRLQIVTNDRFLDWKPTFRRIGEKGFLVKGRWSQGSLTFRGLPELEGVMV